MTAGLIDFTTDGPIVSRFVEFITSQVRKYIATVQETALDSWITPSQLQHDNCTIYPPTCKTCVDSDSVSSFSFLIPLDVIQYYILNKQILLQH